MIRVVMSRFSAIQKSSIRPVEKKVGSLNVFVWLIKTVPSDSQHAKVVRRNQTFREKTDTKRD